MSDYATNTLGLPKTDFDVLAAMGQELANFSEVSNASLSDSTMPMGKTVVFAFQELENKLQAVGYNVFSQEIDDRELMHFAGLLLVCSATRENIRLGGGRQLNYTLMRSQMKDITDLARKKDAEYGASWCKRGGVGAWLTTVRKFDRVETQLGNLNMDMWDVSQPHTTESIEETIIDGINYLLLIVEKRRTIRTLSSKA